MRWKKLINALRRMSPVMAGMLLLALLLHYIRRDTSAFTAPLFYTQPRSMHGEGISIMVLPTARRGGVRSKHGPAAFRCWRLTTSGCPGTLCRREQTKARAFGKDHSWLMVECGFAAGPYQNQNSLPYRARERPLSTIFAFAPPWEFSIMTA